MFNLKNGVIVDIETEKIHKPSKIWVASCREVKTGKVKSFLNVHEDDSSFVNYLKDFDIVIGHNIIGFDDLVLRSLSKKYRSLNHTLLDTLVCSRLLNYSIEGGHSLKAWGKRLGFEKIDFNEFDKLSREMVTYCEQDTLVTLKLVEKFRKYLESEELYKSFWVEHQAAYICRNLNMSGFYFNLKRCTELIKEVREKKIEIEKSLKKLFPPVEKEIDRFYPTITKKGLISKVKFKGLDNPSLVYYQRNRKITTIDEVSKTEEVVRKEIIPFNPNSPKQVCERLWDLGWKPTAKTKGYIAAEREKKKDRLDYFKVYGWKINDENLATLPKDAPEAAQSLVQYLLLSSRLSTLEQWKELASESPRGFKIHGSFLHIGSWTHRMSHQNPNMANIPSNENEYGKEFRELWIAPEDYYLVGTDADGIQMRIFAHYTEDQKLIEALVNGNKEDGTDVHTMHALRLGLTKEERPKAKTFIYAFLLGAGVKKLAEILDCNEKTALEKYEQFLASYPKLKYMKDVTIPRQALKGYFRGLDGRYVVCKSEHKMLAGMLQNGEAVVMKLANVLWRKKLKSLGIDFTQVNFVHDEWQTYVKGDKDIAELVGKVQAEAIKKAGELLNVRCPLSGSYSIGKNWSETH